MNEEGNPTPQAWQSRASVCATECAKVFADFRLSPIMDVADLLGAMFITNADRLSKYWDDPRGFGAFIYSQPEIGASAHQIERLGWQLLVARRIESGRVFKEWSPQFEKIYLMAKRLAHFGPSIPPGSDPSVFPEHLLLAIAEQADLEIARRLLASGLQVEVLRRDVEKGISQ